MNSDSWAAERYQRFQKNLKDEKLVKQQQANAFAKAPSMLARLRDQVVDDVAAYNNHFGFRLGLAHCKAHFEDLQDDGVRTGFEVRVGTGLVKVVLQKNTSIICFEYTGLKGLSADCVQAYSNGKGIVGYWYRDREFVDEKFLSRTVLLDPILCG